MIIYYNKLKRVLQVKSHLKNSSISSVAVSSNLSVSINLLYVTLFKIIG